MNEMNEMNEINQDIVIISRHPAAIEFVHSVRPEWRDAPVLASATVADVAGKTVVGNVPLHLAAAAQCVWAIEFAGAAPRGTEYGLAEMQAAGAQLVQYGVAKGAIPWDTLARQLWVASHTHTTTSPTYEAGQAAGVWMADNGHPWEEVLPVA